jgi:hypothetical protein
MTGFGMTHVLKSGKTNLMGESKANQTSGIVPDQRSFPQSDNFPTEKQ